MTLLRSMQDGAFARAVAMLDKAVALDPAYARAYAARAIGMGFRLVTLSNDVSLMAQAAKAGVAQIRAGSNGVA